MPRTYPWIARRVARRLGTLVQMNPSLKSARDNEALWKALLSNRIQVVATDHCAFTTEQKRFGVGNFAKIPNGTGGLEDRMPMLWTHGVATGRLTMNEFVAVTSTNIAKILNCYPKKGAVLVGADADLVVWDPKKTKTITAKAQQSAIDYNVFEGKKVRVNGQVAGNSTPVREGDTLSAEGLGRIEFKRIEGETRRGNVKLELEVHR
ncbi:MAG: amidohydrolase family protein [Pleurocapsa sp. SU_196_0]|nr:amidohydrolase family protein [Pleurocapsa sp. SU_196_0]